MLKFLRWMAIAVALWIAAIIMTILLRSYVIQHGSSLTDGGLNVSAEAQDAALRQAQNALFNSGNAVIASLWPVMEPALQFGAILAILLYAAERIGLTNNQQLKVAGSNAAGIQPMIALIVVGAFSLSALTGLGGSREADLKDIALVVVGFYFGTRRRDADSDEGAAAARSRASAPRVDDGGSSPPPPLTGTPTEATQQPPAQ
jgi:hypothetical protein